MSIRDAEVTLNTKASAYHNIQAGARYLLSQGNLIWPEKLLLSLVARISHSRQIYLMSTLPAEQYELNVAQIEATIAASKAGHTLGQWEPVADGWQASCVHCQDKIWVEFDGLAYDLLAPSCCTSQAIQ